MLSKCKHYGFFGTIRILYSLLMTKLFYSDAKLVRHPIDLRNSSAIKFGKGFVSGFYCRLEVYESGEIYFGENCQINDFVHISSSKSVKIGNNCLIASKVYITDLNHGNYNGIDQSVPFSKVSERELQSSPVSIGDNVWIGESVSILPGVEIGDNVIIGSNSVVSKSFGDNVIIGGVPAKILKHWDEESKGWIRVE